MKLRIVVGLLAGLLLGVAVAADKPADVRDLMTATQFHATGLDRLNPEQLAAFNAWLAAYAHPVAAGSSAASASVAVPAIVAPALPSTPVLAAPAPAPAATSNTSAFGQQMLTPEKRDEPARIESTIVGHFTGWNGTTVFKLANGQVWKQAESGYLQTNLQDPKVVIKRLAVGYLLTLPSESATLFVTRVQ